MEDLDGFVQKIDAFRGRYFFMSNFYPAPITYRSQSYHTSEHAYQAARARNKIDHDYVMNAGIPAIAKHRGHQIKTRDDWDEVKLRIMYEIVECKFDQHDDLRRMLMDTSPAILAEGNTWGDTYWGECDGFGENHLGVILMALRDKYVAQARLI